MSINSLSNSNLTGTQNKNIRQAQVDQSIKSNQFQIEYLIVGGGGGGGTGANVSGSAGGSGIVVLKYLTKEATITVGGSLTSSSTTSGEFTIVTFTAGSDTISFA